MIRPSNDLRFYKFIELFTTTQGSHTIQHSGRVYVYTERLARWFSLHMLSLQSRHTEINRTETYL